MSAENESTDAAAATDESWLNFRRWLYVNPELGFYLDLSRMGLEADVVDRMRRQFDEAFAAMADLESGAIANPDENRRVGHYWLRCPELAPEPALAAAINGDLERVRRFAGDVHRGAIAAPTGTRFGQLLVLGIGGSALGPQFVADALAGADAPMRISFLDNTDPEGFERVLDGLADELAETLVVVISKSGGTAETRNAMIETRHAFSRRGLDFARHAVAVTQEGSRLDRVAVDESWLARFPMYDWIGGRTSETSVVGLLPAALQGIDIDQLLCGARLMDEATRVRDVRRNPAAMLALAWFVAGAGRGAKDMVILPYKDRLILFSRYLQQLVMESLGKGQDVDGRPVAQGIAVYGNKGSTDQHAYVQQLREGIDNFFVTFIEVLRERSGPAVFVDDGVTAGDHLSGFLQGTRSALTDNGRRSITITVDEVSARSVGALIALFERAVGLYASLININAYHQPGVEAGKRAAAGVLELQRAMRAYLDGHEGVIGIEALADVVGGSAEAVYVNARHLAANRPEYFLDGDIADLAALAIWRRADEQ